jgi:hypothetical protein
MKHFTIVFCVVSLYSSALSTAQEQDRKLEYFLGEWKSVSIDKSTGQKVEGHSAIKRVIGDQWLEWIFRMPLADEGLEVITLINYDDLKKQYAFYSFNPMDEEPIPHFGNWIDAKRLRIKTDFGGQVVWVDFVLNDESCFEQFHYRVTPNGEKEPTSTTIYSKIK